MSEKIEGTKILLTQEDARVYNAFRLNREKFIALLNSGAFEVGEGKIEINCHNGQIQSIYIHKMTYKRSSQGGKM